MGLDHRRDMHRRREGIVGGLALVDVVVGVDGVVVVAEALVADQKIQASSEYAPGPVRTSAKQITARLIVYSAPGGSLVIK